MKKKGTIIGYLIVFCGIIWVLGKIGWGWILALVIIGVLGWVAITFKKDKSQSISTGKPSGLLPDLPHDEFGPLFDSPQQASTYYHRLMRSIPEESMRLRTQQILRESLQIALSSKKRDTAENSMKAAKAKLEELQNEHSVPKFEWHEIQERFLRDQREFSTVKFINQARGLIEHGSKLKTEKSRKKYLDMAKAVINEGLNDPSSDEERLTAFLKDREDGPSRLTSH